MSEPDTTVPNLALRAEGLTDSQVEALLAAARSAPVSGRERWQPPTVEELQRLLPRYEIQQLIARGGMGAVYRGLQKTLRRTVAIKVLPPSIEDGEMQFAARFKHEAQAMAQLSHPNIVSVFDAGETPEGLLYFVMEFVEGTDVAQLITREGRIEPQRAMQIIAALCDALAFAHEEGIIHRDIKPANVMIDKKGRVKVADFGLAKTINIESTLLTGTRVSMGTPDFMAPESLIAGHQVDHRADLYAVGVMLYQMLTGKIPRGRFALPSGVVPQVPAGFDTVVDRAMQTDRDQRYSTALEIKKDVESLTWIVVPPSPKEAASHGGKKEAAITVSDVQMPLTASASRHSWKMPLAIAAVAMIALASGTFILLKKAGADSTSVGKSSEAKTLKPADASPSAEAPIPWHDWLAESEAAGTIPSQLSKEADGWRITQPNAGSAAYARFYASFGKQDLRDAAVRVTFVPWEKEPGRQVALTVRENADRRGWRVQTKGTVGQWVFNTVKDGISSELLTLPPVPDMPAAGESRTVELRMVGNTLSFFCDGIPVGSTTDATPATGLVGFNGSVGMLLKKVEWADLKSLPESEALKPVGLGESKTATPGGTSTPASAPYPTISADGDNIYPPGVWTRVWTSQQERQVGQRDGEWTMLKDAFSGVGVPGRPQPSNFTNCGFRLRFRGQRIKDEFIPQINLQSAAAGSWNLFVEPSGSKLQIRKARPGAGFPILAEIRLQRKLREPSREYVMEFYTIGRTLIGRIDDETVTAQMDEAPAAGTCGLYGANNDFFRDMHFLNLDGVPEAEALKLAGVRASQDQAAPPAWQRIDFAPLDNALVVSKHKNASKEGDLLLLRQYDTWPARENQTVKDGAVRTTFVLGASPGSEQVVTRVGNGRQYQARLWPDKISFGDFGGTRANQLTDLKKFPIPGGLKPGAEVTLQLASIGAHHFVWWNGQLLGSVDDGSVTNAGVLAIQATSGRFKSMEWLSLDGLPEAEALKLVGVAGSGGTAPPTASWMPAFGKPLEQLATADGSRTIQDGWLVVHNGLPPAKVSFARGMARVRLGWLEQTKLVKFAVSDTGIELELNVANKGVALHRWIGTGIEPNAPSLQPPIPLTPGAEVDLQIAWINGRIYAWVEGQLVGSQPLLPEKSRVSNVALFHDKPDQQFRIRNFELLNLDGLPESEALKLAGASDVSVVYPPGQWTKVLPMLQGLPDGPVKEASRIDTFREREGWMVPLEVKGGDLFDARASGRDAIVRATFRYEADANHFPQLAARSTGKSPWSHYIVRLSPDGSGAKLLLHDERKAASTSNERTLGEVRFARPFTPDESYTMELAVIGRRLIARCQGQIIGDVTDAQISEGVPGIRAGAPFRDWEVMNLDGLPEAEVLKLTGVDAGSVSASPNLQASKPSAATPPWQRFDFGTLDATSVASGHRYSSKEGGMLLLRKDEMWAPPDHALVRNGAVRATFVWGAVPSGERLVTRMDDARQYYVRVWKDNLTFCFHDYQNGQRREKELKAFPFAPDWTQGSEVTLQLASIGRMHFVWLNGKLLGSVEDDAFMEPGQLAIQATDGRFKSMEWLSLDGLPEAEALKLASVSPSGESFHTFGGHRYQFVPGAISWADAEAKAGQMGGHLVTITSKEEDEWLKQAFFRQDSASDSFVIHLGGKREGGQWAWITGEPFVYVGWLPGEPNSPASAHTLQYLIGKGNLGWDDRPDQLGDDHVRGFIVEWDDDGKTTEK